MLSISGAVDDAPFTTIMFLIFGVPIFMVAMVAVGLKTIGFIIKLFDKYQ